MKMLKLRGKNETLNYLSLGTYVRIIRIIGTLNNFGIRTEKRLVIFLDSVLKVAHGVYKKFKVLEKK